MSPTVSVPSPPAFLDPLTEVDTCYYYAVPKFLGQNHPSTRWLITMIKNCEDDRLKHKMETSPFAFKGVYYQMMDYPQMYIPEDVAAAPMFKRQAVVYLTPLGMAIYLGNAEMVELLLNYKDVYDEPICDPNEPQYATHLQDNEIGDFHAFPPFLVMMRRSCFGCVQPLLRAGWDPSKPVAMPMRRKFERRVLYYRDWLDVALSVMATRPMYLLQVLVRQMVSCIAYKPLKVPMKQLLPPNPEDPVGLIDVNQLPPGVPMIGVRSLLDMAKQYDRYLQMRQCAKQVAELKREAIAVGLNPEVLMIQAQDFDGDFAQPEQTEGNKSARGANNSSAVDNPAQARLPKLDANTNAKKSNESADPPYVSEGCRILHYALMRDSTGKSMQTCLEAFCVLLRRGFYLQPTKPAVLSSLARDIRNIVVLLLNLVQREQSKVDMFVEKIKSGVKRFAHLEEHKQLENRKTACIQCMSKLVGVLTKVLLHAKLVLDLIQADFPPYHSSLTNIALNPYLAQNFQEIKLGIIREFNLCNDAWVFLDKEMLQAVSDMPEIQLHMKVGTKPKMQPTSNAIADKNESNMTNTNSCFVSYTRVQRRPKPSIRIPRATPASSIAETSVPEAFAAASGGLIAQAPTSEDGSAACLPMDSSADLATSYTGEVAADHCDDGDMRDFRQMFGKPVDSSAGSGRLNKLPPPPSATEAPMLGDSPDMEQQLANLCREVDSLFRPLEDEPRWVGNRSALIDATRSSDAAVGRIHECSTIEPELASTPVPTPGPSLVPNPSSTAGVEAVTLDCSRMLQLNRRRQAPLPPALRKKLKQSGVLQRLLSRRQPAKDSETDAPDSET